MTLFLLVSLCLLVALLAPFSAATAFLALTLIPVTLARQIHPDKWEPMHLLMLSWLLWLPATLLWSMAPGLALSQLAILLLLPLGWLLGTNLCWRGKLAWMLEAIFPALLITLLLWGIWQGPNTFTFKPQGPFNDPNTYAATLNLLVLPILARYLAADLSFLVSWQRAALLAIIASTAFVAFLVASRGATLSFLLVAPLLFWSARSTPGFRRKILLLAVVIIAAYIAANLGNHQSNIGQRLLTTMHSGDPSRIQLMHSAWLLIKDSPWWGSGLGSFRLLYPRVRSPEETSTAGGWVHNDYLQLWQEAGFPMLLLILGLLAWVAWSIWRALTSPLKDALLRMGYLVGIAAVLIHALVNFLLFIAFISFVIGFYLARLTIEEKEQSKKLHFSDASPGLMRQARLLAGGYSIILGWLLFGQVTVDILLGEARVIQKALLQWNIHYPRYQVAYWTSVFSPLHPTPQQIMGLELSAYHTTKSSTNPMRDEALSRMKIARQLAPCYLPYASSALNLINQYSQAEAHQKSQEIIARNLECNPRHGLTYYYAGLFSTSNSEALDWWLAGMAASPVFADDLILASAILSRTTPIHGEAISALTDQMAAAIREQESNPGIRPDQLFWSQMQHKLYHFGGLRYLELIPAGLAQSTDSQAN